METALFGPDDEYPLHIRLARRTARVLWLAGRGFVRDEGFHHASALAFDTVLALVPLLIIVAGVLRALGAWNQFLASTIEPWLEMTLGQSPENMVTMREAFVKVIELGEKADVTALGFIGVIALLYLVLILLTTVETTLNRIWGARRPRSLVRRAADYAAILFVIPFGLVLATAMGAGLGDFAWLGGFRGFVREVVAMLAVSGVLTFLYLVMPAARSRFRSALIGGLVAGAFWHLGLEAYAQLQIGVARYNVIYSGFATLPLFLVWIFVSWLLVLFGAELAAAHQDESGFRWRVRDGEASARTRHRLGVRFTAEIARSFVRGEPPPDVRQHAEESSIPTRLAEDVLDDLARHGIVLRAHRDGVPTYVLSRDPRTLRLSDVLLALDESADPYELGHPRSDEEAKQLAALVDDLEKAPEGAPANLSLRELVEWLEAEHIEPETRRVTTTHH